MKNKKRNYIKNNLYFLGKIAKISPWRIFHTFLSQMLDKATWAFFTIVFMRYLFGAEDFNKPYSDVAVFLIIVSAAMLVLIAYNAWYQNIFIRREDQKIAFALNNELFVKATSVDISCYENPEFYDQYTKAATEASNRAQSVLNSCANFVSSLFSTAYVLYNIATINLFAGLLSFIPLIGTFFFGRITNKISYDRDMENIPNTRRMRYVNRVMYLPQYAKEMRLTGIFNVMRDTYDIAFKGIIKTIDKYGSRLFFVSTMESLLCFPVVFESAWLLATYLVMVKQSISVGTFIMLANAVVSTTWMLKSVQDGMTSSMQNAMFIENIKSFLQYTPKIDENQTGLPVKKAHCLEFQSVSFRYTDEGRFILRNVSLTVKAGEKICLVGHNGAGKTTLVKLVMRLYDPTEGKILLNGIDIRQYDLKEYRAIIGAAFQDFQMFSLSVLENVIMKRLTSQEERENAVSALKQSGAYKKIETLENKEDSILTREFENNGAVLSGGEYQKIAMARAFAKNAGILILDEPSSALDPVAEYMMYETIMRLCEREGNAEKIAIIISHRLSSAAGADRVYMLEQGEVLESGTHKELLLRGGAYADMYRKQAESYLMEEAGYGA